MEGLHGKDSCHVQIHRDLTHLSIIYVTFQIKKGKLTWLIKNERKIIRLWKCLPASCSEGELLGSREAKMGRLYLARNCLSVPRKPGIKKSNNDHNSKTLFWMGVPDKISRWAAVSCLMAFDDWHIKYYCHF